MSDETTEAADAVPETGPQSEGVSAYLLTWNPENWPWATIDADANSVASGKPPGEDARQWSCGVNGQIRSGARLFLIKQGSPPRGIIGSGRAVSDVFESPHWDPVRAANGDMAKRVRLQWDTLLDPYRVTPLDPRSLSPALANGVNWSTPSSGISIASDILPELEHAWSDHVQHTSTSSTPTAAGPDDVEAFLSVMRRYRDEHTVFQSAFHGNRYYVTSVESDRCTVKRVDAESGSDEVCPVSSFLDFCRKIAETGGSHPKHFPGYSAVREMTFVQSPRLAHSPDMESVLDVADLSKAAANLTAVIRSLNVDRSSGEPKLYKPVLLAAVIQAIDNGQLPENHIEFDWVLPQFLAKAQSLGVAAGPEQAALAFYHLTGDQLWLLSYRDSGRLLDSGSVGPAAIRDRVSHASIKETYWKVLQSAPLRRQILAGLSEQWFLPPQPAASTGFWWVNQRANYDVERRSGCIWANKFGKGGREIYHWTNISRVKAGDIVFHAADGAIRSVSIARRDGHADTRPYSKEGHDPSTVGWVAELDYYELPNSVPTASIGPQVAKLDLKYGPFNYAGTLNQSYLTSLSREAAGLIAALIPMDNLPQAIQAKLSSTLGPSAARGTQFWTLRLGPGGRYWDDCYTQGIGVVGCDHLGPFTEYKSKAQFFDALKAGREDGKDPDNDALMCWQFTYEMKIGDIVFAATGINKVVGVGRVTSDYFYDNSRADYRSVRRVQWLVRGNLQLPGDRSFATKTLTNVSRWPEIADYVRANMPWDQSSPPSPPPYTTEEALADLFMDREDFDDIVDAWERKKNLILQGPPGVGKTFIAKRLAYALIGRKDPGRLEMIQFHQSYSYEDFIQGWRPEAEGFARKNGIFYEFCQKAMHDPAGRYVFIIDEINRGNLSRIFGELLMLIENDRRGPAWAMPLTYSTNSAERFYVPENLFLLGMMNTADRSLAMVDYALRRRFCFASLRPAFGTVKFRQFMEAHQHDNDLNEKIQRLIRLNEEIAKERDLGPGFEIGHSYFCPSDDEAVLDGTWFRSVIQREIAPLIREYWFDNGQRAEQLIDELLR